MYNSFITKKNSNIYVNILGSSLSKLRCTTSTSKNKNKTLSKGIRIISLQRVFFTKGVITSKKAKRSIPLLKEFFKQNSIKWSAVFCNGFSRKRTFCHKRINHFHRVFLIFSLYSFIVQFPVNVNVQGIRSALLSFPSVNNKLYKTTILPRRYAWRRLYRGDRHRFNS